MPKFGLIGYPLTYSFSPGYFKEKFTDNGIKDTFYDLYPLEKVDSFCSLIDSGKLKGLNVTIPYKESVIPFLDDLAQEAKNIGAVNTIKIEDGKTKGFNTDVYGFEHSLIPLLKKHHKKALILGTGGASKAVCFVFDKLNIDYKMVSRTPSDNQLSYKSINQKIIDEFGIIVNTTPLGTHPDIDQCPDIPYEYLNDLHLLYDLVYNPSESLFLKKGKAQNSIIKNGYEMLCLQADKAWEIWNS